jgi:hypothetical protein
MHGACDQFLAGTGLALDKDRAIGNRIESDIVAQRTGRRTRSENSSYPPTHHPDLTAPRLIRHGTETNGA